MATALNGVLDSVHPRTLAEYFELARQMAESRQLDFLEFLDARGNIISSAQWPAKFGYPDTGFESLSASSGQDAFLKREELQDSTALRTFRGAGGSRRRTSRVRGRRAAAGQEFSFRAGSAGRHARLALSESRRSFFAQSPCSIHRTAGNGSGRARPAEKFAPIIDAVRKYNQEMSGDCVVVVGSGG